MHIYTDGACRGNPGPGSYGVVIYNDDKLIFEGGSMIKDENDNVKIITNNIAELKGAIKGLSIAEMLHDKNITMYTDSQYVKNGVTKWMHTWKKNNWKKSDNKPVLNLELWKELYELNSKLKPKWIWIPREKNSHADKLANEAFFNSI